MIGTLGAVDPYLINQIILYHKNKNNNEDSEMLQNLPSMLGIEPHMIKSNQPDQEPPIRINRVPVFDFSTELGVGQLWQSEQKEIPIVLDINRPIMDENTGMGGGL